jgi:hypothetical protein
MPITIDGTGTITGISAGGLPDSSITNADLATDAVSTSKILNGAVTTAKLSTGAPTWDSSNRLFVNTSTGHGTLQVHDGTFVLSKPASGSERNWRLLPSDAAAGDLAIQQSTTAGGTTYSSKFAIGADGSFSSVIPGGSTLYPRFGCRAWVNFNGTGTVAIRASGNVSSITDNGTGDYTVNFTTAMADANYASAVSAGRLSDKNTTAIIANQATYAGNKTVSAFRVVSQTFQNGNTDVDMCDVSIFR